MPDVYEWLRVAAGDTAARGFETASDALLLDLFPHLVHGPHTDEMVDFFRALNTRVQDSKLLPEHNRSSFKALTTDIMHSYVRHMGATYNNNELYLGLYRTPAPRARAFALPWRQREDPTTSRCVPVPVVDLLPALMGHQHVTTIAYCAVPLNLILTQHWLAQRLDSRYYLPQMIADHQAFCHRWDLPKLSVFEAVTV